MRVVRARATPSFNSLRPASKRASSSAKGSSKKSNTRCEVLLRRALTAAGLRYRLDASDLAGRPDIVFRGARVAVFCDGDFWHGRNLQDRVDRLSSGHNASYWVAKIQSNVDRDAIRTRALEEQGWLVLRYWESDIHKNAATIAEAIADRVNERRGKP